MLFLSKNEKRALGEFSTRIKNALGDNLFDLKLFGSKSTGKFDHESDIDILLIVNHRDDKVLDVISDILLDVELNYASKISPVVLTTAEFLKNQQHQTLFYQEITRDGVTL
ncbi:nucleotidyltransferase domain-containing protein [Desulfallas sp. Bu1-1]|uniref:nucleotidyltransferase domain-containing protein n=1 Tax=Desulfallas sp. Bu1-1 TaxID=2787620 RepID=UPI00189F1404|nr:nucleotidyltransferase domain-containing protein [Desulfallas sp. Bu1-1]MBF7084144.1 nucleotidyltransferase domain-containing protein [Desulfallas sp. Bu1-1]